MYLWSGCAASAPGSTLAPMQTDAATDSGLPGSPSGAKRRRWIPGRWSAWALAAGAAWSVLMGLAFPLPGRMPSPGNEPSGGMAVFWVWCMDGVWPCAVLAWAPLALLVLKTSRQGAGEVKPGRLGLWFAIGTLPFWGFEQWWVARISSVGYFPMIMYLAAFNWLNVWGAVRIARRCDKLSGLAVILAAWILAVEVFRGEIAMKGYPWYLAGHPLIRFGPTASLASIYGAYGVSFVVLTVSLSLGMLLASVKEAFASARTQGMVGLIVAVVAIAPAMVMKRGSDAAPGQIVRVALIQTNVPQDLKMSWGPEEQFKEWQTLEAMTARAVGPKVGLIVWPETMMPGMAIDAKSVQAMRDAQLFYRVQTPDGEQKLSAHAFADRLVEVQKELNTPIVVGEEAFEGLRFDTVQGGIDTKYDRRFNSAFVVQDGKVEPRRYDKVHLTPFGEEMPYISNFKWLERLLLGIGARGMKFDLSEGAKPERLLPRVRMWAPGSAQLTPDGMGLSTMPIATPICFEIADSSLVRSMAQATTKSMPLPTKMIISITNDGWFGDSDKTRRQHVQLARWRAAELGLPTLRAANTGDSCGFDAWGRPIAPIPIPPAPRSRDEGIAILEVPLREVDTVYGRMGNAVGWVILAWGAGVCAMTFRRK